MARVAVRLWLLTGRFPSRTFTWSVRAARQPAVVLMCLWNRPGRIDDVLTGLDRQDYPQGVRLFLWNNRRREHRLYVDALRSFRATGSLREVSLVRSPYNLGSIARFYWGRRLVLREGISTVIVLDDDQDIDARFISTAMRSARPRTIAAWWAWRVGETYWDRVPAVVGDEVNHVGPGGMVADASFLRDRQFFTEIPDRWGLLDDVWLTHFTSKSGYLLTKLEVNISFVMPETNQFHTQIDEKSEFWEYLRRN